MSHFQAASIVRTVALAFKAIGKLTRDKIERESRRARRTQSVSSSERTRTNSEVSTTSTIGSSSVERRHPHAQRKHGLESSSGRRSPHGKKFNKSTTSPSILRHPTSSHTSGRHVEFSALSPVPSDGSDSDGKEAVAKQAAVDGHISVKADVHMFPASLQAELPVWVKREDEEPVRRSSLPIVDSRGPEGEQSILATEKPQKCHSLEELHSQLPSEPGVTDSSAHVITPPRVHGESSEDRDKKDGKKESHEPLEKEKTSRELDFGTAEKGDVTENFLTTSFLPIEHFYKEPAVSPDRVSSSFGKYKELLPQDVSLRLSDNEEQDDPVVVHNAITAVERGQTGLVEKYLDDGLSVNAHDTVRRSLLYYSVSLGDVEMSQLLLKRYG